MKTSLLFLFIVTVLAFSYGLEPGSFDLVSYPEFSSGFQPEFSSYAGFSFSSGQYGSTGEGTYLGRMSFSLHPKVDAIVELGYSKLLTFSDGDSFGRVLGGFQLNWRPSENSVFSIVYHGSLPEQNLNLGGY